MILITLQPSQRLSGYLMLGLFTLVGLLAENKITAQTPANSSATTEFLVPPPPPPPPHPMAQINETPLVYEDLRSPRQILYEQCLDRMADLPDAPEDYVARCMGEPASAGSSITSNPPSKQAQSKPSPTSRHLVPGFSAKNLTKQAESIPAIVTPCYDQLLASMRKRGLNGQGDTSIAIFLRDSGRVESVTAYDSEIVDERFLSCIESAIQKTWKVAPSASAPPKRNAINNTSMVLSFDTVGSNQPKNRVTVSDLKRVQIGGLSAVELAKNLSRQAGQLKSCKASTLPPEIIAARKAGARPTIVINMDVDFMVDENGKVADLSVSELSSPDAPFKKCISERILTWTFQKPRGRQKTPVNQSLKLTPISGTN